MGQSDDGTGMTIKGSTLGGAGNPIPHVARGVVHLREDDARTRGVPFRGTGSTAGTSEVHHPSVPMGDGDLVEWQSLSPKHLAHEHRPGVPEKT